MATLQFLQALGLTMSVSFLFMLWKIIFSCWISPTRAYRKVRRNGLGGPTPSFPLGNTSEMKKKEKNSDSSSLPSPSSSNIIITHDIHPNLFPYFARWQQLHGKVFVYWLGTEPFLYIADPEFLRKMSAGVMGKSWGKPTVFKKDREPMFGNGLNMAEGNEWVRHRHIISPAFSPTNLKDMTSVMVESTNKMLNKWATLINSGKKEIDVDREITSTAGEIIAKTSFGLSNENGKMVFEKLRAMQVALFKSNRNVGVPFGKFFNPTQNLEARRLGKEIDRLLLSIIIARKKSMVVGETQRDLLGLLLAENHEDGQVGKTLTTRQLVDECKTFFFGGHETTALAITWTLLLLAMHPHWQEELREEIKEVVGDKEVDFSMLAGLKKMGWVMNEVLRLYPSAVNAQRQSREDIQVDNVKIPNGTNMWIDLVSMHHDREFWGDDVHEFKPERFQKDNLYGGCKHKMGYLPFGFGGRMCVGRNLTAMEYKIVMTLILTKFSFSLSPSYSHQPTVIFSLRPTYGLPLIFQTLHKTACGPCDS